MEGGMEIMSAQRPDPQTADRRRRIRIMLAVAGVTSVVGVVWWASTASRTSVPAADGPVASTFDVPTYSWDEGAAMDAAVSGTLWFTNEGCPLLSTRDGDQRVTRAVIFPNATGVIYDNGVRAVVDADGDVYAVEGQSFSYAGGYGVRPKTEAGKRWLAQCPTANLREGALVNDHPATPKLTHAPEAPSETGPTAPTTDEELGFFAVPTFTWDPATGGKEETTQGTMTLTAAGCPTLRERDGATIGLVFPNAEGFDDPNTPDGPNVYSSFPNGTSGLMATHGQFLALQGGTAPRTDPTWTAACASTSVESVFYVYDAPFPVR
jgi:hypothetical protein